MTASIAAVKALDARTHNRALTETLIASAAIVTIAALARVVIHLPWTPVPITGQTFGVALTALLLGRNRALGAVAGYILVGALGAPVFSAGTSMLTLMPTIGYLFGMLLAAPLVGWLSDLGATKNFFTALAAAFAGSVLVFACGVFNLAHFMPGASASAILAAGVTPFLLGDFVKNVLAASIATRVQKSV